MKHALHAIGPRHHGLAMVVVACIPWVLGCIESGPKLYEVTGTVSYQGKPLPLGKVFFVPEEGRPGKPGKIDEHGHYQLEATAGRHAVGIIAMPPLQGDPSQAIEAFGKGPGSQGRKSLIPTKYNRFDTSDITVTVEPGGPNQIDINLE